MARYYEDSTGARRTDHTEEIQAIQIALKMMEDDTWLRDAIRSSGQNPDEFLINNPKYRELLKSASEAVIALLEVHDTTGISLENWGPVAHLVNLMLGELGPFLPNGV